MDMKYSYMLTVILLMCCIPGAEAMTFEYAAQWGEMGPTNGQFYYPYGVAADSSGNVYVADTYNHRVQKFGKDGGHLSTWTNGTGELQFNRPRGFAVEAGGTVYVCDGNMQILKFAPGGAFMRKWGGFGADTNEFLSLNGIAVDDSTARVYAVDGGGHTVKVFSSTGVYKTEWAVVTRSTASPAARSGLPWIDRGMSTSPSGTTAGS